MADGLTTIAEVRAWRGAEDPNADITNPAYLNEVIKLFIIATSEYIEKYCGRVVRKQEVTEYFNGNNEHEVHLSQPNDKIPVDTTEEFKLYRRTGMPVTETLIATDKYEVFDDGMIVYPAGFQCSKRRNYKAIYTMGFDCTGWDSTGIGDTNSFGVPADMRKACAMQTALNMKKMSGVYGDSRLGLSSKGLMESETIIAFVNGIEDEVGEILKQFIKVAY